MVEQKRTFPRWHVNPLSEECDVLIDGEVIGEEINGTILATVENFGYASYPTAFNAKTGRWERGGAYSTHPVEAYLWAERIAGLHPLKEGDGRPAFYYDPQCQAVDGEDHIKRCTRCKWVGKHPADYDKPECCLDAQRPR